MYTLLSNAQTHCRQVCLSVETLWLMFVGMGVYVCLSLVCVSMYCVYATEQTEKAELSSASLV